MGFFIKMETTSKQLLMTAMTREYKFSIVLCLIIGLISMTEAVKPSFNDWYERLVVFIGLGVIMGTLSSLKLYLLRMAQG